MITFGQGGSRHRQLSMRNREKLNTFTKCAEYGSRRKKKRKEKKAKDERVTGHYSLFPQSCNGAPVSRPPGQRRLNFYPTFSPVGNRHCVLPSIFLAPHGLRLRQSTKISTTAVMASWFIKGRLPARADPGHPNVACRLHSPAPVGPVPGPIGTHRGGAPPSRESVSDLRGVTVD